MEGFIDQYGLLAVFLGCMIEGDVTLVLAGVVAHLGFLAFAPGVVVGAIGLVSIDAVYFALGRRGRGALEGRVAYDRVAKRIESLATRLGPGQIVLSRAIYGTRVATMLFWGAQDLPWRRFLAIDLAACTLWSGLLISIGYLFSNGATAMLGEIKRIEYLLLGAALVTAVMISLSRTLGRRGA